MADSFSSTMVFNVHQNADQQTKRRRQEYSFDKWCAENNNDHSDFGLSNPVSFASSFVVSRPALRAAIKYICIKNLPLVARVGGNSLLG